VTVAGFCGVNGIHCGIFAHPAGAKFFRPHLFAMQAYGTAMGTNGYTKDNRMSSARNITAFINEHRTLFIAVLVGLFLLELEIFAVAVTQSGKKSVLEVRNNRGEIVYEADGSYLSAFDQETFEKTFGPLTHFEIRRVTREVVFPFRAWFTAAVGLPLGGMLVFAFVVRAFVAIFHGDKKPLETAAVSPQEGYSNRVERVLDKIGRLHIFTIGFFMFLAIIGYWIIPNMIVYVGKLGFDTIERYKWFFLGGALVLVCIFVWVIYLRYLLAKKHIESRVEIDKYRLRLEFEGGHRLPLQLESPEVENRTCARPAMDEKTENGY
jgi:hypothetical protein